MEISKLNIFVTEPKIEAEVVATRSENRRAVSQELLSMLSELTTTQKLSIRAPLHGKDLTDAKEVAEQLSRVTAGLALFNMLSTKIMQSETSLAVSDIQQAEVERLAEAAAKQAAEEAQKNASGFFGFLPDFLADALGVVVSAVGAAGSLATGGASIGLIALGAGLMGASEGIKAGIESGELKGDEWSALALVSGMLGKIFLTQGQGDSVSSNATLLEGLRNGAVALGYVKGVGKGIYEEEFNAKKMMAELKGLDVRELEERVEASIASISAEQQKLGNLIERLQNKNFGHFEKKMSSLKQMA